LRLGSGAKNNLGFKADSEMQLHRDLAESDFRYSNRVALGVDDPNRANSALPGIVASA